MTEVVCKVCGIAIIDHKDRRLLFSSANKHIAKTLEEVVAAVSPETSLDSIICQPGPCSTDDDGSHRQPYLCRWCHSKLDSYEKLQQKLIKLREFLEGSVASRLMQPPPCKQPYSDLPEMPLTETGEPSVPDSDQSEPEDLPIDTSRRFCVRKLESA